MANPVAQIGVSGSGRYTVDWSPLAAGLASFGDSIGRGLEARGRYETDRRHTATLAELFAAEADHKELVRRASAEGVPMQKIAQALTVRKALMPPPARYDRDAQGRLRNLATGEFAFEDMADYRKDERTSEQKNVDRYLERNPGKTSADYFAMKRGPEKPPPLGAWVDAYRGDTRLGSFRANDPELATLARDRSVRVVGRAQPTGTQQDLGLTTSAQTQLQKDTISAAEVDAGLSRMAESFDPKYLSTWTQLDNFASRMQERAGIPLSDEGRKQLEQFATFKQGVIGNLNRYIKDMTGAQMSEAEAKRLSQAVPTMSDSPTEFRAKMDAVVRDLRGRIGRFEGRLSGNVPAPGPRDYMTGGGADAVMQSLGLTGPAIPAAPAPQNAAVMEDLMAAGQLADEGQTADAKRLHDRAMQRLDTRYMGGVGTVSGPAPGAPPPTPAPAPVGYDPAVAAPTGSGRFARMSLAELRAIPPEVIGRMGPAELDALEAAYHGLSIGAR